jgi:hypothetical protein
MKTPRIRRRIGMKRGPVGAWQVRDDIETRAKRGNMETLDKILARVPNVPPLPGDEK